MEWTDFLGGIIAFLFDLLATVASIIIAPVDLMVTAIVPQAGDAVGDFFEWVLSMLASGMDFIEWFFYVLGITPATWALISTVVLALLLVWIFMFPFKLIFSVFRGMRD